jgi:hypothetical protein
VLEDDCGFGFMVPVDAESAQSGERATCSS